MSEDTKQVEQPATETTKVETEGATVTKTSTEGVAADDGEQVEKTG